MRRFAAETSVPVSRTRDEIERLLTDHGASHFGYFNSPEGALIAFQIDKRNVKLRISIPTADDPEIKKNEKGWLRGKEQVEKLVAQGARQSWRVLLLVLKAKLEAVAAGISTIEQEFLSWIITPNGQTVGEVLAPQLKQAYEGGRVMLSIGDGR